MTRESEFVRASARARACGRGRVGVGVCVSGAINRGYGANDAACLRGFWLVQERSVYLVSRIRML